MQATPATWQMLIDAGWRGNGRLTALCGGEALLPALAAGILARTASLWNLYGPTETTIWSTFARRHGRRSRSDRPPNRQYVVSGRR